MSAPLPYPRVAHLVPGRGSRDDLVLSDAEVTDLLGGEVVVEEKLDGANVTIWVGKHGRVEGALRGGPDAMDRSGQRGPLRAWVATHEPALRAVLSEWAVLYGEWLLLTHTVAYEGLPSYLAALDLWREGGFADVVERDRVAARAGLVVPPEVWRGVPAQVAKVEGLLGNSAWGSSPAEGLVVRRVGVGEPRLAKLVRTGFDHLNDEGWRAGRPRNRLAEGEASWR